MMIEFCSYINPNSSNDFQQINDKTDWNQIQAKAKTLTDALYPDVEAHRLEVVDLVVVKKMT